MKEVCKYVQIEPTLLPINEIHFGRKVNTADNVGLDISARGLWNTVPAKEIFTLTEYFYKEFKRKDFTIYVFYSAFNQYFVISPFELMTI